MNIWARYKGILYDASLKSDSEVIVRTLIKSESDNSFFIKKYPDGTPCYIKYVPKSELEELYEEREYGTWNDIEFVINGETEKTYTIWYWNKDEKDKNMCKLLGMKVYDKGIYVKEVPKTEVTNYRIEKEDLLHK